MGNHRYQFHCYTDCIDGADMSDEISYDNSIPKKDAPVIDAEKVETE